MRGRTASRPESLKDLISQAEAARIRGVTRAAIRDLIRRGRLVSVEVGGRLLVHKSDIDSFERRPPGPKAEATGLAFIRSKKQ
jgi:excisionase family DNA binding protein